MLSYDIEIFISQLKDLDNEIMDVYSFVKTLKKEEIAYIKKLALASMIGGSTRIENAKLTDQEVNWLSTVLETTSTSFEENRTLIENKLSKDRERSYEEVVGCRAMIKIILEEGQNLKPFCESDLMSLHRLLLKHYPKAEHYLGVYKKLPNSVVELNNITKKTKTVFKTADPGIITSSSMQELIVWYNDAILKSPWAITVACEFVFRFLAIHPFQDGNGRLARGLFILSLIQSNNAALVEIIQLIAIDRHVERYKEDYYIALNKSSDGSFKKNPKDYNIDHFLKFMLKAVRESLKDVYVYHERFVNISKLSTKSKIIYECFEHFPEIRLTNQKIQNETNLPRRTVSYCLSKLLKMNLIQKYGEGSSVRYQMTF